MISVYTKSLMKIQKRHNPAKAVFDIPDLVRHIYSFGDPDHRVKTRLLAEELRVDPEDMKRVLKRWLNEGHTLWRYLHETPRSILIKRLNRYNRCYCCTRHNIHKPRLIQGHLFAFDGIVHESHPSRCQCSCRHFSRVLADFLYHVR